MKKVSLLLAVLLVLTCCLLASCGGDGNDTSSASGASSGADSSAASSNDESSAASTSEPASSAAESSEQSSVEPDVSDETSSVEESSEETSSEEESSAAESSEETSSGNDTPATENPSGENLALNKPYTGGDPSTHELVSKYNAKLTDGNAKDEISYDGEWFAFYFNADATGAGNINAPDRVGTVVIDLGQSYSVSSVRVNAFLGNASGIVAPSSIKVEVSADGSSYTQLGSTKTFEKPAENDSTVDWVVIDGSAVAGQYVRVTVAMDAYAPFAFINEIEVY